MDELNHAVKNFSKRDAGNVMNCKLLVYVPISEKDKDVNTKPVTKKANTPKVEYIPMMFS